MKIAIISDVSGNLVAFKAFLTDVVRHGVKASFHLGNLIGYGPNPVECWDLVMKSRIIPTRGEFEHWIGQGIFPPNIDAETFWFMNWTMKKLRDDQREAMSKMAVRKVFPVDQQQGMMLSHATLASRTNFETVNTTQKIFTEFDILQSAPDCKSVNILLLGNNTFPIFMSSKGHFVERTCDKFNVCHHLHREQKYLINPGAIGRPMDGHRANVKGMMPFTYAVMNIQDKQDSVKKEVSVIYYRVYYDLKEHLAEMRKNKFPKEFIRQFTG